MITIGLIGCGDWGRNILRDLLQIGAHVLVASRSEVSRQAARDRGASGTYTASEDLPDCDGYVLAIPIESLADEAIKLLSRKKPIFSEKTLCPTQADAEKLSAAGAHGRIFLMHKWEYHNGVRMLKHLAQSGRLGKLEQIQCQRHGWVAEGRIPDALTLLGVHDLTIVRHILGFIPEPRYALIRHQEQVPIGLTAVLGDDVKAILSVEARHAVQSRLITLMGTDGSACLGNGYADHILIHDRHGEHSEPFLNNMPLMDELKEFVGYLQGGAEPLCGFEHACSIAEALDKIRVIAR